MSNNTFDKTDRRPVVMLANGHPPFDTRIFVKEARTLVDAGYQVSLIVPHTGDESRDGVSILAVAPSKGGFHKLLVSPWNILRKSLQQPSQSVYHIHDSDILVVGVVLRLLGRKVIYDAHEDTPLQISYQHWIPKLLKKPYAWFYFILEKLCGRMFNAVIVAEPVIAKYFPPSKTSLIRNFPIITSFKNYRPEPYTQRPRRLVYVGTLSKVRGLMEMLEGAALANSIMDFTFTLGGKFVPPSLQQTVLSKYRIDYRSWLSYHDMVDLLFTSQIGIIIPNPIDRYKTNYPVKLFEFMAAALPVIASREGESAAFVEEAQCGILVDPLNVKEISDAIVWLFEHPTEAEAMGKRGQELIFSKYNWETESKALLGVYAGLVDR
jgi:glycosyltransferase involved in cell wall biosynthesis